MSRAYLRTRVTVLGLSLNNFENDDYFFNQLRSCHVTCAEGSAISARRHDVQRCLYIVHHSVLHH